MKLRFFIMNRDGFRCRYCGRSPEDGVVLEIDHVVPISAGGTYDVCNLVTTCRECNLGKRDTILEAFHAEKTIKTITR